MKDYTATYLLGAQNSSILLASNTYVLSPTENAIASIYVFPGGRSQHYIELSG
jgi:hypothetical protein